MADWTMIVGWIFKYVDKYIENRRGQSHVRPVPDMDDYLDLRPSETEITISSDKTAGTFTVSIPYGVGDGVGFFVLAFGSMWTIFFTMEIVFAILFIRPEPGWTQPYDRYVWIAVLELFFAAFWVVGIAMIKSSLSELAYPTIVVSKEGVEILRKRWQLSFRQFYSLPKAHGFVAENGKLFLRFGREKRWAISGPTSREARWLARELSSALVLEKGANAGNGNGGR
jgi:hypothetical protein